MATLLSETKSPPGLVISWEALPDNFPLEDEPVDNTGQPLLAGALRESLEITGFIQPQMLIASNFGIYLLNQGTINRGVNEAFAKKFAKLIFLAKFPLFPLCPTQTY